MARQRKPIIRPEVLNPRRKPRPRPKWAYQGHDSATEWMDKAHEDYRILHAATVLMDGRSGNARLYKQVYKRLLQGIVCVDHLLREIEQKTVGFHQRMIGARELD